MQGGSDLHSTFLGLEVELKVCSFFFCSKIHPGTSRKVVCIRDRLIDQAKEFVWQQNIQVIA